MKFASENLGNALQIAKCEPLICTLQNAAKYLHHFFILISNAQEISGKEALHGFDPLLTNKYSILPITTEWEI